MSLQEFDDMFLVSKLNELAAQLGHGIREGKIPVGIGVIAPFIRPIFAEEMVGVGWTTFLSLNVPIQCISCKASMVYGGVSWSNPVELRVPLDAARAFATNLHKVIDGTEDRAWCGTWPIFVDRIREEDRWMYCFQRMVLPVHGGSIADMVNVVDEFIKYIDTNGWKLQEPGDETDLNSGFMAGL